MDERPWWVAEYVDQTVLHPLGLAMVALCGLALLVVPRRYAVWPLIVMACFVAPAQRVAIFTLDFNLLRIMVLFGWVRLLVRGEARGFAWKPIDLAMLAWATSCVVIHTLLRQTWPDFVNRLGYAYDAFGMYFLFRCLIRSWDDLDRTVRGLILVSIPLAAAFLIENQTGRNAFALFGGVPEITVVRDGRLRCQGAFAHAILAGCFWAAAVPMIAAGWWAGGRQRVWAVAGTICALVIVVASASATPVGALLNGMLAACLFPWRRHMRWIRWGVVLTLVGLHLVMKAPVWHLIARVQLVGGATAWHRFHLIDQAIRHVSEWWLLGSVSTATWNLSDITNQYVLEGLRGGLLTLGLFVAVIALAFQGVGRLWRRVEWDRARLAMAWSLGVALWVHCVSFIGVSYFGQTVMAWYLQLAIIGSLTPVAARAGIRAARASSPSARDARSTFAGRKSVPRLRASRPYH